ncbi:hypothetical protein ACFQNE_09635 [Gordonia phosphorivorans]|uniref:Uncharacterized protein n=1 Tax=Gordonia phosphorivorans TaxID=1056982 RepID=A0ABV6H9R1_9ACTN
MKVNGTDATVTVTAPKSNLCSTDLFRGDAKSLARQFEAVDVDDNSSGTPYEELRVNAGLPPVHVVDPEFADVTIGLQPKNSPATTTYSLASQPAGTYTAAAFCVGLKRTEDGIIGVPGSDSIHLKSFTIGGAPGVPGTPDAGGSGSLDTGSLGKLFG